MILVVERDNCLNFRFAIVQNYDNSFGITLSGKVDLGVGDFNFG